MAELANYLKRDFISHTRKVQSLYKRMVRNEENYYRDLHDIKYVWAIVRAEFEKNRYVRDPRMAKLMLEEGEEKLFLHQHPQPKRFIFSPGGVVFEREHVYDDSHMDAWHPYEKAQFPYYFEKREQRKKDYIKLWEMNNPEPENAKH